MTAFVIDGVIRGFPVSVGWVDGVLYGDPVDVSWIKEAARHMRDVAEWPEGPFHKPSLTGDPLVARLTIEAALDTVQAVSADAPQRTGFPDLGSGAVY